MVEPDFSKQPLTASDLALLPYRLPAALLGVDPGMGSALTCVPFSLSVLRTCMFLQSTVSRPALERDLPERAQVWVSARWLSREHLT